MRLILSSLFVFLSCSSLLFSAARDRTYAEEREEREALFAPIKRNKAEWRHQVQNHGEDARNTLIEAATYKLTTAWNSYLELKEALSPDEKEVPTAEQMEQAFMDQYSRAPLAEKDDGSDFISRTCVQWKDYIERRLQLEDEESKKQKAEKASRRRSRTSSGSSSTSDLLSTSPSWKVGTPPKAGTPPKK